MSSDTLATGAQADAAERDAPDAASESVKRKQIVEGARRTFLRRGFDAASMGEIAREAGVSKGTLYVYFDSKESLFAALIAESTSATAESPLEIDQSEMNVALVLERFAGRLIAKMTDPQHVALVRMVIGAADRFPALAQIFYDAGPRCGARRLSAYIAAADADGRLVAPDPALAAWQFLGMVNHPTLIGVILAAEDTPDEAEVARRAQAAVSTFMAAYAPRA